MSHTNLHRNEVGAVILEFALISGIFIFTILSILDLSRYFAVQAILTKGAQNGLSIAKTDPDFGIDIQRLNTECTVNGVVDTTCRNNRRDAFRAARDRVIASATQLPLSTLASPAGSNRSVTLRAVNNLDNVQLNTLGSDLGNNALVLRPGEVADLVAGEVSYAEVKFHPQICPPGNRSAGSSYLSLCKNAADPTIASSLRVRNPNETMQMLFENYPIVVELTAEIEMFMPLFPKMTVTGTAIGYREIVNRSKVGVIPDQLACPITSADCPCGSDNQVVNGNCECELKPNLCLPAKGSGVDKSTFSTDSCSCECPTPQAQRTNSDVPGSACAGITWGGYQKPDSTSSSTMPQAIWNDELCACECNDAVCPANETVTFPGGGTATTTNNGAGRTSGGCFCSCSATSGRPIYNSTNINPCPGGKTFEPNRCGCTCWAGEKEHCDRAIQQNPGKYVWNQAMCECQCAAGNPDPSCQPLRCYINNSASRTDATNCDGQGRKFDYETCTCSVNCRVDAGMAACPPGQTRQFNGTSCTCGCPTAPQSCGSGQYWNSTSCSCQVCNISCGPLQAVDPATCTCIASGGG